MKWLLDSPDKIYGFVDDVSKPMDNPQNILSRNIWFNGAMIS